LILKFQNNNYYNIAFKAISNLRQIMLIPIELMQTAINEAKIAYNKNEVPIGSVISDLNGNIIAKAHNQVLSLNDPTAHAEILAIRSACSILKTTNLSNYQIFSTVEPCCMCSGAILTAKIKRIYFGLYDEKFGGIISSNKIVNSANAYPDIEIYPEMLTQPSKKLLREFFKKLR